jgi:hypothetical protein
MARTYLGEIPFISQNSLSVMSEHFSSCDSSNRAFASSLENGVLTRWSPGFWTSALRPLRVFSFIGIKTSCPSSETSETDLSDWK